MAGCFFSLFHSRSIRILFPPLYSSSHLISVFCSFLMSLMWVSTRFSLLGLLCPSKPDASSRHPSSVLPELPRTHLPPCSWDVRRRMSEVPAWSSLPLLLLFTANFITQFFFLPWPVDEEISAVMMGSEGQFWFCWKLSSSWIFTSALSLFSYCVVPLCTFLIGQPWFVTRTSFLPVLPKCLLHRARVRMFSFLNKSYSFPQSTFFLTVQ